ncbi:hypothetical protein F5Y11DRAFT_346277 [Daldinia sp. FL1419]|nr:hypothetical protein F5Y11DRAFT_346277 [Daldinia sp. FL1419]
MPLNGKLEANTLYMSLNSRSEKNSYHYGILVTDTNTKATLYHASTNLGGDWRIESKVGRPDVSVTLIVLVKVDSLHKDGFSTIAKSVPADGSPSKRTGEAFRCLTWVKDVLVSLDTNGIIKLPHDIDRFVTLAQSEAARESRGVEGGLGATVVNKLHQNTCITSSDGK